MWSNAQRKLEIFLALFIGALLVLLRLKDKKLYALQIQALKEKHRQEDAKADNELAKLREEYETSKDHLDHDPSS